MKGALLAVERGSRPVFLAEWRDSTGRQVSRRLGPVWLFVSTRRGSAHGFNEMHRHTSRAGKQPGELFHAGTLGEGMRAAVAECTDQYEMMIEAWHR